MIICGFPGVGKTTLKKYCDENGIECHDSDSSQFPKDDFPANYIKHLKELSDKQNSSGNVKGILILASSHKEVREALLAEGLPFRIVVPHFSLKDEYVERYKKRGSSESFIKLIETNFETWIGEIASDARLDIITLGRGQYLKDRMIFH